jgi:hypothetical protein
MKQINRWLMCMVMSLGLLAAGVFTASAKPKRGGGQQQSAPPPPVDDTPPSTEPTRNTGAITQDVADLKAAEAAVDQTFETSPEWIAALAAVKQAQSEYNDACGPVLDALKGQREYKDATAAQEKAEADLTDQRNTGSADQISDAASSAMQAKSAVTSLQTKALATDPSTVAARQKLTEANSAVAKLMQKEQESVHADATWQAAKKKLDSDRGA